MVWNIPLVSWGQLSQLCSLPVSCTPPAYSLVGWGEKQKKPWLCVSTTQQQLKHPSVINTVFSTNEMHSPILVPMKKINSTPAKISTIIYCENVLMLRQESCTTAVLFAVVYFLFWLKKLKIINLNKYLLHNCSCVRYFTVLHNGQRKPWIYPVYLGRVPLWFMRNEKDESCQA